MKIYGRPPPDVDVSLAEAALDLVVAPLHLRRRIEPGVSVVIDESGDALQARDALETVYFAAGEPVDVPALLAAGDRLAASLPRYASPIAVLPPVWDWDVNQPPRLRVTFWARVAG